MDVIESIESHKSIRSFKPKVDPIPDTMNSPL
jgi:hypothetical protein